MKWIDFLISLFSREMRSTLELAKLNWIWKKWNDKELSMERALFIVLSHRWNYHREKVKLLIDFLYATRTN